MEQVVPSPRKLVKMSATGVIHAQSSLPNHTACGRHISKRVPIIAATKVDCGSCIKVGA